MPNKPFPPQLVFGSWRFIPAIVTLLRTEVGTRILGYRCDRPDHVAFGRIVDRLWNYGLGKQLRVLFCRSLQYENVESSADDGGLTCEISEGSKDSTQPVGLRICGSG